MWELIRANKIKSWGLIVGMLLVLLALGVAITGAISPEHYAFGVAAALLIWLILFVSAYFAGDGIMLSMSGAREVTHSEAPRLYNVVEEMKLAGGLPKMPRVFLIQDEALNAFATGRKPERSAVAITSGLLKRLDRDELQGVIAHEMSHILNRDILFMTVAGVMVGSVVLLSDTFLRGMFYRGRSSRRSSSRGGGSGQAQAVFLVAALMLTVLGPILARLLYLAMSRRREYLADASAIRLTRYPPGLASALEKLGRDRRALLRGNRAMAPMYITHPFKDRKRRKAWGSTHPPIQKRIAILRAMGSGADLRSYEQAWRKLGKSSSGLIPQDSLSRDRRMKARDPSTEETGSDASRRREAGDLFRAVQGFAFVQCPCGVKIKVPPRLQQDRLYCPRCGSPHQVPAAPAPSGETADGGSPSAAEQPRLLPAKGWGHLTCSCGRSLTISPAFRGDRVQCSHCGITIPVRRAAEAASA